MKNLLGNPVDRSDYQKCVLKSRILSFYYKRTKTIDGPFCRYDLSKIEAFVETVRDTLLFDVFEHILDYILVNVQFKSYDCFHHLRTINCFNYSNERKYFMVKYLDSFFSFKTKKTMICRLLDFHCEKKYGEFCFTMYVACKTKGYKFIMYENSKKIIHLFETIDNEINLSDDEKQCIYKFDFKKNEVWLNITKDNGISCKWIA